MRENQPPRAEDSPGGPRAIALDRKVAGWVGAVLCAILLAGFPATPGVSAQLSHGLWVWHGPTLLEPPEAARRLRDYCRARNINEVYVAVSDHGELVLDHRFTDLIQMMHRADIRVEALLSSVTADEPGAHRDKLIAQVRSIVQFNQHHPAIAFDGIHLDIEPQQRTENKGAGNLRFLPGLVETYRQARAVAERSGMSVDADIQNKLLKGSISERRSLLEAVPRLTLMLYELGAGARSHADVSKAEELRAASLNYLAMGYAGLPSAGLAALAIGLRTPDYGTELPTMLAALDEANRANPHYRGWAQHAYNDVMGYDENGLPR